jgi:hypothetical protein
MAFSSEFPRLVARLEEAIEAASSSQQPDAKRLLRMGKALLRVKGLALLPDFPSTLWAAEPTSDSATAMQAQHSETLGTLERLAAQRDSLVCHDLNPADGERAQQVSIQGLPVRFFALAELKGSRGEALGTLVA